MSHEHIEKKIKELEEETKEKNERNNFLELYREYEGDDEIITSVDYRKSHEKREDLYLAYSQIRGLDNIIEGFRPGTVVIVSGPTKQGKTTLCQTLTHNFYTQGFKSLWFSFDTPTIEVINRMDESISFYVPKQYPAEKKVIWIEEKIIESLAKYDTRIVFIDHLEFITGYSENFSNYATELQSIVRELKRISIKWNVTLFVNHHLRQINEESIPNWTQLKNSSGVAQDSDITIMMWRNRKKDRNGIMQYENSSIISVQLHRRTGKTGYVRVNFSNNLFTDEPTSDTIEEKPF